MAKTSMQDIADALNISKNAVSLAINGKPGISDALRDRIIEKAKELDYGGLQKIRMKKKNLLLIVDDKFDRDSEFFLPLISSILRNSAKLGYSMMMISVSDVMQENCVIPGVFYEIDAAGVVFLGWIRRNYLEHYVAEKIPCVMMLLHHYGVQADCVLSANVDGAYLITKYLLSCGHEKIGYIANIGIYTSFKERFQGYCYALTEAGIERKDEYEILLKTEQGTFFEYEVKAIADRIVQMENAPTAWLCGNDELAVWLINALKERGLGVPEDISIAGFDGIQMAYLHHPRLCTYAVDRETLGREAVKLLLKRVQSGGGFTPVVRNITGELERGASVKNIKEKAE